jgi:hypothetical protein
MANTFKLKRSAVQGRVPTTGDLQLGELALNTYDGKLYTLKNDGAAAIVQIGATATTPNSLTFNNGGSGGASGSTFDGNTALTVSYNTIGAPSTTGTNASGSWGISITGNAATATQITRTVTGTNSGELVRGNMADNDQFRILVGGTASNAGFAEIATADDGTEPIHVRQYTGTFATLIRTATLLDGSGNTIFPGIVQGNRFTSTVGTGTAPFTVASTTLVTNLNANLLNGLNSASANTVSTVVTRDGSGNFSAGTITAALSGNATTATTLQTTRTLWGQNFNGGANVSGNLTAVGNITGTGAVTLTATSGTLGLVATGANIATITTNSAERVRVTSAGDVGIGTTSPGYKLEVNGSFAATTKSFVIDHPTRDGYKLRYGSLEGPELGVYVRGRSKEFVIELPEYWTKLIDADSITVNLTPIGKTQTLWVKDIRDNKVYVGSKCSEVEYFFTVFAERADVDRLEVEVEVKE